MLGISQSRHFYRYVLKMAKQKLIISNHLTYNEVVSQLVLFWNFVEIRFKN